MGQQEIAKNQRERRWWDWRWLAVVVIAVVALVVAIIVNIQVTDNSAGKLLSGIKIDNSDLKVNWDKYQTVEMELTESLTITESGTYHLTGSLADGSIVVDAGVGEVRLVLDNVSITNLTGPAILAYNAENLVIELVGDNTLADGASYGSEYNEDVDGVVYSKADLALTGAGELNITANHGDGIVGKDDVVFRGGSYAITAKDDGIRGKDSVYITGGLLTIMSEGDAIKSTNETDFGKGFVMVEDGSIAATAAGKGLKATNTILISGGDLALNTYDDAIHTNNYVGITGGEIAINAGDDGVHADRELIIDGGAINIAKAYEGLEAQVVTINDGVINVVATDDGINAGGGADSSSVNRVGANPFAGDEDCVLTINGGNVYINAAGDGMDSNGYLVFNGGYTVVDGPTNNGNGALDAGLGISLQGGSVVAVGAAGMAESLGSSSGVCNISVYFSDTQAAGTLIEVKNSANELVLEHVSAKTFSHLAAGTEALVPGETYTIYLNGEEYQSFMIMEVTTVLGNVRMNSGNMPPGGGPGQR